MARRTATITQIRYYKKRARGDQKYLDVADLPGGGDLLTFAYAVWAGLRPGELHDRGKQRYRLPDEAITKGRTLLLSVLAGNYGDPGSVRHVETGVERIAHTGDLTNAVQLRLALFVPLRGTTALMVIEHAPGISFGSAFLDHLKLCWDQRYPDFTLKPTSLVRPDAWLANAQLEAVTAEVYNHKTNVEDSGIPKTMGVLKTTLEPKKGTRFLPRELLDRLTEHTAERSALLGLTEEPDEVKVRLGDGEQSKTFVLGKDRTPAVRLLVTDYGEPALKNETFRRWAGAEISGHLGTNSPVGGTWDASMLEGDWAPEVLDTKVTFDHGR